MVRAVEAVLLPDDRLHLGRRLAFGHPQVVLGHVDDGGPECCVAGGALAGRVLEGHQVDRKARRRRQLGRRLRHEGEPGDCTARAEAHQRGRLLPPGLASGRHEFTSFPMTRRAAMPGGSSDSCLRHAERLVCDRRFRIAIMSRRDMGH